MIEDLSRTLKEMLSGATEPPLSEGLLSFERPSEAFATKIKERPTVNLFLYDIRENTSQRSNEQLIQRNNGEAIITRPPIRVACSYLATAWSPDASEQGWLQEHRLLGQILQVYSRFDTIPRQFLQGALADQEPLPPLVTAMIDPQKNFSEFWTALGNRLRPSLTITATIAINEVQEKPVKIVTSGLVRLTPAETEGVARGATATSSSTVEEIAAPGDALGISFKLFRVEGRVVDKNKDPIPEASVLILMMPHHAVTDQKGKFVLERVRAGRATLRVKTDKFARDFEIVVPSKPFNLQIFEFPPKRK